MGLLLPLHALWHFCCLLPAAPICTIPATRCSYHTTTVPHPPYYRLQRCCCRYHSFVAFTPCFVKHCLVFTGPSFIWGLYYATVLCKPPHHHHHTILPDFYARLYSVPDLLGLVSTCRLPCAATFCIRFPACLRTVLPAPVAFTAVSPYYLLRFLPLSTTTAPAAITHTYRIPAVSFPAVLPGFSPRYRTTLRDEPFSPFDSYAYYFPFFTTALRAHLHTRTVPPRTACILPYLGSVHTCRYHLPPATIPPAVPFLACAVPRYAAPTAPTYLVSVLYYRTWMGCYLHTDFTFHYAALPLLRAYLHYTTTCVSATASFTALRTPPLPHLPAHCVWDRCLLPAATTLFRATHTPPRTRLGSLRCVRFRTPFLHSLRVPPPTCLPPFIPTNLPHHRPPRTCHHRWLRSPHLCHHHIAFTLPGFLFACLHTTCLPPYHHLTTHPHIFFCHVPAPPFTTCTVPPPLALSACIPSTVPDRLVRYLPPPAPVSHTTPPCPHPSTCLPASCLVPCHHFLPFVPRSHAFPCTYTHYLQFTFTTGTHTCTTTCLAGCFTTPAGSHTLNTTTTHTWDRIPLTYSVLLFCTVPSHPVRLLSLLLLTWDLTWCLLTMHYSVLDISPTTCLCYYTVLPPLPPPPCRPLYHTHCWSCTCTVGISVPRIPPHTPRSHTVSACLHLRLCTFVLG